MTSRRVSVARVAAPVVLLTAGCLSDDASPVPTGRGTGGVHEAGAGADGGGAGGAGGQSEDGAIDAPSPRGERTVALLHGLTDTPWIAFCFARVEDGVEGALAPEFVPESGLRYGQSARVEALPGGARFGEDTVRPYVVAAASASVVRGLDCGAVAARVAPVAPEGGARPLEGGVEGGAVDAGARRDAGPSDAAGDAPSAEPVPVLRMTALPVIPARALEGGESYLLALGGCLGGPGLTAPAEVSICGVGYAPDSPTLSVSVVRLSRETDDTAAGLQFLVATPAFGRADLALVPALSGERFRVAEDVAMGALRPARPYFGASAFQIGAVSQTARVQVFASGSLLPAYDGAWRPTLDAGRLMNLADGETYTLVLLGPTPGFAAEAWWNGPLVTLVQN